MNTDRPGAGTSPYVVPPCYPQVELGWTHTESSGNREKQKTDIAPDTLVRLGRIPDLELRLGYVGYAWERASGNNGAVSGGVGLSDAADDWYVASGIS